jgi:chromosome partitioning protein
LSALSSPRAQTTLGNRVVFAETLGVGLGVCEAARTNPATLEIAALAAEIDAMLD